MNNFNFSLLPLLLAVTAISQPRSTMAGPAPPLVEFDFRQAAVAQEWRLLHDITNFQATPSGIELTITGGDPYFAGPGRDYPADTPLWLDLRVKSEHGGHGQIFYFREHTTEKDSAHFDVTAGQWRDVRLKLPALGPGYRFRIDPPGTSGKVALAWLRVSARVLFKPPTWPAPVLPRVAADAHAVTSGALKLVHAGDTPGSFELQVDGRRVAVSHNRPMIGYLQNGQPRWFMLSDAKQRTFSAKQSHNSIVTEARFTDPDRGRWQITQRFFTDDTLGAVHVETRVDVDQDRSIIFLPMLVLLPGAGTFGTNKTQGFFAGLEYLGNEPSSSEADLTGPAANRLVPDTLKLTFPLMTIAADDRYVALTWDMAPQFCALFDSPDRTFGSGAHALALLFPGSNGQNREDGHLLPYDGEMLKANQPIKLNATILGGTGKSVVPSVQQYFQLHGLPPVPAEMSFRDYVSLAAGGWLDSKAREGNLFRHAVWQGFGAQPAADAAFFMDWLATRTRDTTLAARLTDAARDALTPLQPGQYLGAAVGHVRMPVAPLVYGHVLENVQHAQAAARGLLGRFDPDGRVLYQKSPNGLDYGKTHFAPDANGLTAQVVLSLLEAAVFSGDRALIEEGLKRLHALDKFRDDVPRGAQTWEVPLHTPDILASAHLVRAYTLGYELTGDPELLAQARYWAWTGVPFVYLRNPTGQPIGPYSTIPVFGATSWVAPVWIGLPVQWCGLVYADALYRLTRHDPRGPWRQLADGITAAGLQHTWPRTDKDRQGLLPDVFNLRAQHRDGPAINPGTVQVNAARLFRQGPLYDFRAVRERGWLIHAPGEISAPTVHSNGVQFTVAGWPKRPYYVLVNGINQRPKLRLNGKETSLSAPHDFSESRLVLQGQGTVKIEITSE